MHIKSAYQDSSLTDNQVLNLFIAIITVIAATSITLLPLAMGGNIITRETAFSTYIKMILLTTLMFLIILFGSRYLIKRHPESSFLFYSAYVTLVTPVSCLLISLTVCNFLTIPIYSIINFFYHGFFILFFVVKKKLVFSTPMFTKTNHWIVIFLPLALLGFFWSWFSRIYSPDAIGIRSIIILVGFYIFVYVYIRFFATQRIQLRFGHHWWIYILLGFILVGLVYFPKLDIDRHHYNFFLAPINDILHGSTLLVNSTSQYGIGVIYFLVIIFQLFHLPVGYFGLSLIVDVLFLLQYIIVFILLKKSTKNLFLALAGIIVIIYFNYLSVTWNSMLRIPAQSPLRYGLSYLVILTAVLGLVRTKNLWHYLEFLLIGVCSVWSLEAFVYSLIPLVSFHFIIDVLYADHPWIGMRNFIQRLVGIVGVVLLSWIMLFCFSWYYSHDFPNLSYYLEFFKAYTFGNIDSYGYSIDFRSIWTGVATSVYLVSIFLIFFNRFMQKKYISAEAAALLMAISILGLLQYSYYFVYNIDYHFSLLCVPFIIIIFIWAAIFLHDTALKIIPKYLKLSFSLALVTSAWLWIQLNDVQFRSIIKDSLIYQILVEIKTGKQIYYTDPSSSLIGDTNFSLVTLIQEYASKDSRVAIFAQSDDQTEALLLTGKIDLLGMSEPGMSSISPTYSSFVLDQARKLSGEPKYIFYDSTEGVLIDLQEKAFELLTAEMPYLVIDRINNMLVYSR